MLILSSAIIIRLSVMIMNKSKSSTNTAIVLLKNRVVKNLLT